MRRRVRILVFVSVLLCATSSWASPNVDREDDGAWYGGEIWFVSATSQLVMWLGAVNASPIVVVGLGGYVLGGPIVHLGHGNALEALGSLALNVVAPIGTSLAAVYLHDLLDEEDDGCAAGAYDCSPEPDLDAALWAIGGIAVGMVLATALDAELLAYEDVDERRARAPTWRPELRIASDAALVGAHGTF